MNRLFDDRVTIYLAIESVEVAPSILTERLGMCPDRQWVIGEARGKTGKRWERHGWVVETIVRSEEHGGRSASELIPIAIEKFQRKVAQFAQATSSLGASAERYTVLAILAEDVPGIELNHPFLQLLTYLGGTFQVDLSVQVPVSSTIGSDQP
ncbi:MAG: DUF4279 domain-containing protein [Acidobacteriota bacterium]|nr:DUF4279 domain-containing protein [Acidobacteriota bacterium]